MRVQTTINHISIFTFLCFLCQYQRQRKCFLSERELRKALRDTLTRAAWLGPGNFLLVRSEHAHASYPGLFFRPPGFSPYMGREERRVQGLDYAYADHICKAWSNGSYTMMMAKPIKTLELHVIL